MTTRARPRRAPSPGAASRSAGPAEITLATVQREFPGYACWRGISGLYYARPCGTEPGAAAPVSARHPPGLREAIFQHQAATRDAIIQELLILIFGPPHAPPSPPPCPVSIGSGDPATSGSSAPDHWGPNERTIACAPTA